MRSFMSTRLRRRSAPWRVALAAFAGAAVLTTLAAPAQATGAGDHSRLLAAMNIEVLDVNDGNTPGQLHGMDQIPGIIARTEVDGAQWTGVADNHAAPVGRNANAKFRAASNTKMFTAVVVQQLVAEGRLSLDSTVYDILGPVLEHSGTHGCDIWTWKCFRAPGYNGKPIKVLNLLNMSSGIKNYLADTSVMAHIAATFPNTQYTPQQLVDEATANGPQFEPGAGFEYSNTNYVLLGMIVEKVTGKAWEDVVTEKIITPLGLADTTVPKAGDNVLPQPHDAAWTNLLQPRQGTVWLGLPAADQNMSYGYGTGSVVSTTGDLLKFMKALLTGQLLAPGNAPGQLGYMLNTQNMTGPSGPAAGQPPQIQCNVVAWYPECFPNPKIFNRATRDGTTVDGNATTNWYADQPWQEESLRYGLGVSMRKLTCSNGSVVDLIGHNGAAPGSFTYTYSTPDASHMISLNYNADWTQWEMYALIGLLAAEFCPAA